MMIKAKNIIMKERIWINRVISKIKKQPLESDTDAQLHNERIITVRQEFKNCTCEWPRSQACYMLRSMRLIPTNMVGPKPAKESVWCGSHVKRV